MAEREAKSGGKRAYGRWVIVVLVIFAVMGASIYGVARQTYDDMSDAAIQNLNEKTNEEIEGFLKKSKEELFNLRFQHATGQLDNTARLKAVKRDIARMYTVLRERELGISQAPAATETKAEEK